MSFLLRVFGPDCDPCSPLPCSRRPTRDGVCGSSCPGQAPRPSQPVSAAAALGRRGIRRDSQRISGGGRGVLSGPWARRASVSWGVWHPWDAWPEGLGAWEGPRESARPGPGASAESRRGIRAAGAGSRWPPAIGARAQRSGSGMRDAHFPASPRFVGKGPRAAGLRRHSPTKLGV